ncbi:MAG: bifunctional (p)ppGpp synthetase/guanosine-3',5'-bis(diphosphate) 3'-pyrophosphohydrolase [Gammaproteobacteria bacterium]|nr:bifunctional (p)ppGpp synthetase/guanosine-3',5'-bis(diphosphate) 3'-pyrophosphohydrolase [Gammaproteobacteria bacterium]
MTEQTTSEIGPPGGATLAARHATAEVAVGGSAESAERAKGRKNKSLKNKPQKKPSQPRESYFQNQLRVQATEVAVPATLDDLLATLGSYLPDDEVEAVERAYHFAETAHEGQFRRTGHQYITHPLAVAAILADMRMDHQSIMAAVMHDVLEDTGVSKTKLAKSFGKEVAEIVDGVSKLATIFNTRAEAQAENFQKMAMATARDLRVILVKLADRLHNMRTIGVMPPNKRKGIARETLDFYAPIANRLGMNTMRLEFEELAFQALYPLRADRISRAVASATGRRKSLLKQLQRSIEASLHREGIDAKVIGRQKHLYSIYRKMKTQRKSFADLMDVFGFRIIVDRADTCYRALGVVHNLYKPVLSRFKDYIAIPKANGYQSLHTALVGMHGVPIEVQIRTRQMDTMAEQGIAGHWLYKNDLAAQGSHVRARQWVAGLLDLQQRAGDSLEFIESLKIDLFPDEVYVFTPKGEILELPRGACAIDFAYAIHTDIGNHCVACRIDRSLAPLSAILDSGQTVEIITAADARPSPDWLTFTVSSRARSAIRQALKVQQRSESVRLGRRLLDRSLRNANTTIKALDFRRLRSVFREFGVRKLDDLLAEIGIGNLMAYAVAQRLLAADNPAYEAVDIEGGGPVAIRGGEGLVITYARCCGPVPGDHVVGHMTPGKGLVVHVETCNNVGELRRKNPREIIPSRWATRIQGEFETTLDIAVNRRKGVIAELANGVNSADAGINNIVVDERSAELSSIRLELSVHDKEHLDRVRQRLLSIPAVQTVDRLVGPERAGEAA